NGEGNIDQYKGQVVRLGGARPGQFWPSIDKGPEGFWVAWQDDRDKEGDYDLFVRHVSNDLETLSPETRLTDYHAAARFKWGASRVKYPSIAVSAGTLLISYRLENEKERTHSIIRLRVPLTDAEKGLAKSDDPNRSDRIMGDPTMVSEERVASDASAIAC